mgnify:FL=1
MQTALCNRVSQPLGLQQAINAMVHKAVCQMFLLNFAVLYRRPLNPLPELVVPWRVPALRVDAPELPRVERKEPLCMLLEGLELRKLLEGVLLLIVFVVDVLLRLVLLNDPLFLAPPNVVVRIVELGCRVVVVTSGLRNPELPVLTLVALNVFDLLELSPMRNVPLEEGRLAVVFVLLSLNEPLRRLLPNRLLSLPLFTVTRVELLPPARLPLKSPLSQLSRIPPR